MRTARFEVLEEFRAQVDLLVQPGLLRTAGFAYDRIPVVEGISPWVAHRSLDPFSAPHVFQSVVLQAALEGDEHAGSGVGSTRDAIVPVIGKLQDSPAPAKAPVLAPKGLRNLDRQGDRLQGRSVMGVDCRALRTVDDPVEMHRARG